MRLLSDYTLLNFGKRLFAIHCSNDLIWNFVLFVHYIHNSSKFVSNIIATGLQPNKNEKGNKLTPLETIL